MSTINIYMHPEGKDEPQKGTVVYRGTVDTGISWSMPTMPDGTVPNIWFDPDKAYEMRELEK